MEGKRAVCGQKNMNGARMASLDHTMEGTSTLNTRAIHNNKSHCYVYVTHIYLYIVRYDMNMLYTNSTHQYMQK